MYEYIYTYNKNLWKYSWKFEGGEVYMEDFGEMEKEDRNKTNYNFKNKQIKNITQRNKNFYSKKLNLYREIISVNIWRQLWVKYD